LMAGIIYRRGRRRGCAGWALIDHLDWPRGECGLDSRQPRRSPLVVGRPRGACSGICFACHELPRAAITAILVRRQGSLLPDAARFGGCTERVVAQRSRIRKERGCCARDGDRSIRRLERREGGRLLHLSSWESFPTLAGSFRWNFTHQTDRVYRGNFI
jgi:hypothetical protein